MTLLRCLSRIQKKIYRMCCSQRCVLLAWTCFTPQHTAKPTPTQVAGKVPGPEEFDAAAAEPVPESDRISPRMSTAHWQAKLAQAKADQDELLGGNERLQRQIRSVLDMRRKGPAEDDNMLGTAEARYSGLCSSLEEQKRRLANIVAKFDRIVEELRLELQERLTKTTQVQNVCFYLAFCMLRGFGSCKCTTVSELHCSSFGHTLVRTNTTTAAVPCTAQL